MRNSTPRRSRPAALTTAVAVTAGVAALSVLAGCGSDASTATDPTSSASPSTSITPTPTPAPTESAPPSDPASSTSPTASSSASAPSAAATTLELITLAAPTEGQAVSGSFDVHGTANSPEANVPWTIKNAAGKVVAQGAFTADGWMDKLYPYNGTIDVSTLTPGTYQFTVAVDEESDGESSKAPQVITVSIVVS